jgi:hypothetical protein
VNYKRGLAVVIGCVVAAAVSLAATWPRFHPAAPVSNAIAGTPPKAAPVRSLVAELAPLPINSNPLSWARLTDAQRTALAPFAADWDKFSDPRRRKWLRIAARYPKMSPVAQKRLHERMTEWVRMTPEQRRVARENYQVSKDLPAQARKKAWTAYQQLSAEQKARLAASERRRRPTVVSAPPTGKSEMRDIDRLVNERARLAALRAQAAAAHAGSAGKAVPQPNAAAAPTATANAAPPASAAVAAPAAPASPAAPAAPILQPNPTYKGS